MGKRAQITPAQKTGGVFLPIGPVAAKAMSAQKWRKDLLVPWLFQTCIRPQTSLDRRFLRFGMTVQEASALLRCVEARTITPGRLAVVLGRDKGKMSRVIDRLGSSRLLLREIDQILRRLHNNAVGIKARGRKRRLRERRRIGSHRVKSQGKVINQPQVAPEMHSNDDEANTVAVEFA